MRRKQGICLLLSTLLLFSMSGCGQQQVQEAAGKNIELLEPVNVVESTEKAAYRNIYNYKVYSANVMPQIQEYAYDEAMEIESCKAFWGETVKKGATLMSSSTKKIDEQIEDKEEFIADMEESMAEAEATLEENLAEPREEEKRLENILDNLTKQKPAEKIPASELKDEAGNAVSDGDSVAGEVTNPAYEAWQREYTMWEGKFRVHAHNIDMQEESMRQRKALYELDHAYQLELLKELKESRKGNLLTSSIEGEVVAMSLQNYGTYKAEAEEPIIAVGDIETKILKTEFINKTNIASAADIYAMIDGVRYEVEYQPMDSDEYAKLTAAGKKVYSTFVLKGDCSQLEMGDFAVITLFTDKKENVLSVPKDALRKDETGYFVYVAKDGENIATPVKTGITDGVYTEILSGIAEGDAVLVEKSIIHGGDSSTVSYGNFGTEFEGRGMMYYSEADTVRNPIEYGTVYFGEFQVAQYEHVEKGDVLATLRVVEDDIALQRNRVKLQRAQERLADLKADGEEKNEDAIAAKQEEIDDITELLEEMEQDGKTTKIVASRSGIVVGLADYETETILFKDSYIADIADEGNCYIVLENTNQLLNYGNEVSITYTNNAGEQKTSQGVVANAANIGLSEALQSEISFILLPQESIADMSIINSDGDEWWNRYRYQIQADIRQMDNVLVVPKKAVTEISGKTYVNVVDEEGNVKACSVVAGGYDTSHYWIIEGLSEGMVVCLK